MNLMNLPFRQRSSGRILVALFLFLLLGIGCVFGIQDPVLRRAAILGGATMILWLTEAVPPFVPTLALAAAIPVFLGSYGPEFGLRPVLTWAADPILALFFAGFTIGIAASRHGLDVFLTERALALARFRRRRLLAIVMGITALLSMWMSNVAAAAMMLAALRPHLDRGDRTETFRCALLLGLAMAANFGGMATPIGTGPNGIAIALLDPWIHITFLWWMGIALPLTGGALLAAYALIAWTHRVKGNFQPVELPTPRLTGRGRSLVVIVTIAILAWLSESWHGIPAPSIGLVTAAVLFGGGWIDANDLRRVDWSTLGLIAGGLMLGQLVERSEFVGAATSRLPWEEIPVAARSAGLVFAAALMSAVMSNTASAAILIPFAHSLGPPYSIGILIAIGASFGVPFIISSPPNAMAYGQGGLTARDFLRIGLPLMIVGSILVGLSGPFLIDWLGLP